MATAEQEKFVSSDVRILSGLALNEASKTFSLFANEDSPQNTFLRSNVAAQQSTGLLKVSLEQDLIETEKLQKALENSKSLKQELDLLGLSVENRPNVEMLDSQATQLEQQLNAQIDTLNSTQKGLGKIILQIANAFAAFSADTKQTLESHGATDVDPNKTNQSAYALYVNPNDEKEITKNLVGDAVPETNQKPAMKEIRSKAGKYNQTIKDLQKEQDKTTSGMSSAESGVTTVGKSADELKSHEASINAFNNSAEKTIRNAREAHKTETKFEAPEIPGATGG